MTSILGISAFYHDSAAALVVDGTVVAAAQEERFTRIKHDASFPERAIEFCLTQAGLNIEDVDYVAFYEKPFLKLERILETYLTCAPSGYASFRQAIPLWLKEKLFQSNRIKKGLGNGFNRRLIYVEHHQSHAASTFFASPYESAAILTADGVGEWATTTCGVGSGSRLTLSHELRFPNSLGLLYSAFTAYCGFRVNGGEGKLMGLAPLGTPEYVDLILQELIDIKADGSFRLNMEYFDPVSMTAFANQKFNQLFGGPPRQPEAPLETRFKNVAASIQAVTERIVLAMANALHQSSGESNLCLAGGVALNCVANGRLAQESKFENIWIQPAAGDAGGSIGAALFVWCQLLGEARTPPSYNRAAACLGPAISTEEVRDVIKHAGITAHELDCPQSMAERVAQLLEQQHVIGWVQGRMEFGPRALGNRSILADPRNAAMQARVNQKIKRREAFRPFAPVILSDHVKEFFSPDAPSPFMLLVANAVNRSGHDFPLAATTHLDGTARLQTCDPEEPIEHQFVQLPELLQQFNSLTGCPALLNTSFNVRGEPIVCDPVDAIRSFVDMKLDALVIDRFLILRTDNPALNLTEFDRYVSKESPNPPRTSFWQLFKRTVLAITFPIRCVVSEFMLGWLFFVVFNLLGMLWRSRRESYLDVESVDDSYWQSRETEPADESYFQQF
ncbi:MAG: carbamoyltransferase [Planctomycetota bacterium]